MSGFKKGDLVRLIVDDPSYRGLGIVCHTNWRVNDISTGLIQVYWQVGKKKAAHKPYFLVKQDEIEKR